MVMLLTLSLILTTIHVSIDAPPKRGFSYAELWMLGMQFPIIFSVLESGFLLYKSWKYKSNTVKSMSGDKNEFRMKKLRNLDYISAGFLMVYFILFQMAFWLVL